MIDGPVSGGVPRAKTGELAIMVGGDAAIIDAAMPVLSAMGTSVLRTGGVGSGQAMKALNNLVSTGGFLIGIEALLIGQRFGLDPAVMTDVLNAATGMNNSTQKKFRQFVLSRKFNAGFTMGLLAKDLSIAMQVGRETGTAAPLSALVQGDDRFGAIDVRFGRGPYRDGEVGRKAGWRGIEATLRECSGGWAFAPRRRRSHRRFQPGGPGVTRRPAGFEVRQPAMNQSRIAPFSSRG